MNIFLIDARNAVYRNGYTRGLLRNSAGKPTGAIFGILSCILRLKKFYPDAQFVFCWDGKEPWKSWRHIKCKDYKANRHYNGRTPIMPSRIKVDPKRPAQVPSEPPQEVKNILAQIPAIKKVLGILGIPQFEVDNLEADDLIGILSRHLAKDKKVQNVYIYSMDKDFYQLIGGKVSVVRDLDKAKKCKAFTAKDVEKEFGIAPGSWVKYRSLIGDPSDGIKPPFRGVGKVTALKLLAQGLDPSKKAPTSKAEKKFAKDWQKCHLNYILSKIITKHDSSRLPTNSLKQLDTLITSLDYNTQINDRKKVAKQFIQFCAEYELNWILEQRHQFLRTPR